MLTGGGTSAGHVTPSLAVAHELKRLDPNCETIYIAQSGDTLGELPKQHRDIHQVFAVHAGKFRRYHGAGWSQIVDLPTLYKNIRDLFLFAFGIVQSYFLLRRLKPDCIFMKGGYVGAPVGLAAALLHIPFVTHDSDAIPGLANRIVARWASLHMVALPKEAYAYPQDKTVTVGVPVRPEFVPVTPDLQKEYKQALGLQKFSKILFVTGGGQGSQRLNDFVVSIMPELLRRFETLGVVHLAGSKQGEVVQAAYRRVLGSAEQDRVFVQGFISDLWQYSGAADVVVTRAGATTLAELAMQRKPVIIVPNPFLTGGHQIKNAQVLVDHQAALCVSEQDLAKKPALLSEAITSLLDSPDKRRSLAAQFSEIVQPHAAREIAGLLLQQAHHTRVHHRNKKQKQHEVSTEE